MIIFNIFYIKNTSESLIFTNASFNLNIAFILKMCKKIENILQILCY